jgi:hypothetical protein
MNAFQRLPHSSRFLADEQFVQTAITLTSAADHYRSAVRDAV